MNKSVASILSVVSLTLATGGAVEKAIDLGSAKKLLTDNYSVRLQLFDKTSQIFASEGRGGGGWG